MDLMPQLLLLWVIQQFFFFLHVGTQIDFYNPFGCSILTATCLQNYNVDNLLQLHNVWSYFAITSDSSLEPLKGIPQKKQILWIKCKWKYSFGYHSHSIYVNYKYCIHIQHVIMCLAYLKTSINIKIMYI